MQKVIFLQSAALVKLTIRLPLLVILFMSGYHADTPITIKAEAIHEADSRIH